MEAFAWLVLMVIFLIAEASTVAMVSLWFAAGALAGTITALLGGPGWLQVLLFILVSAGLLAALRPFARKRLRPRIESTNVDAVIGAEGYVIEDIDNVAAAGRVKLGGMDWTARSEDGSAISAGTLVRVARIEGVKAFVTPVAEKVTQTS